MGFEIRHNVSPETLGRTARRTGQIARQERDVDRRRADAKFAAQLRARQAEGEAGRALTRETRDIAVEERRKAGETAAEFQDRVQTLRETTAGDVTRQRDRTQDLNERRFEEAPARHLQESINQREAIMENNVWQFSEQQKRDQQKLADAITFVQQDDNFTPQEKQVAIQELMKRHLNILPQFGPDNSPSAQKVFNSSLVTGPEGKLYQIDDKGNAKWLNEAENKMIATLKQSKEANEQKAEQAKAKVAADLQTGKIKFFSDRFKQTIDQTGPDGTVTSSRPPTFDEINKDWEQMNATPQAPRQRELTPTDRSVIEIATQTLGAEEAAKLERILRTGNPEQVQRAIQFVKASTVKRR